MLRAWWHRLRGHDVFYTKSYRSGIGEVMQIWCRTCGPKADR